MSSKPSTPTPAATTLENYKFQRSSDQSFRVGFIILAVSTLVFVAGQVMQLASLGGAFPARILQILVPYAALFGVSLITSGIRGRAKIESLHRCQDTSVREQCARCGYPISEVPPVVAKLSIKRCPECGDLVSTEKRPLTLRNDPAAKAALDQIARLQRPLIFMEKHPIAISIALSLAILVAYAAFHYICWGIFPPQLQGAFAPAYLAVGLLMAYLQNREKQLRRELFQEYLERLIK